MGQRLPVAKHGAWRVTTGHRDPRVQELRCQSRHLSRDGEIFFGGLNGFNAFRAELLNGNRHPPQVAITEFHIGNTRAGVGPIQLNHDEYIVSFKFAALDYAAPTKSRFMYQLLGLDEDWVDAGTNRLVTYTHLPAGDYTFRVKAKNNDGVWSEQDATLPITVMPAPWLGSARIGVFF